MQINTSSIVNIAWDSKYSYLNDGKYCIKLEANDGSIDYVTKRARIERYNEDEISTRLSELQNYFDTMKKLNDPLCVNNKTRQFGQYSILIKNIKNDEKLLEIVKLQVEKFSLVILRSYQEADSYYAPLLYINILNPSAILKIGRYRVLISNPLNLSLYMENWIECGLAIPKYEVSVIKTDSEFDSFIRNSFSSGYKVIANPLIDINHKIIDGIEIIDIHSLSIK